MPTAPILTDGAVTLRAHRPEDAQGSWEQCQDPLSQQWTTVPVPYSMDDARTFVGEVMPKGWADGSEWGFAVEAEGRYAGTVSLRPEGDNRAELAYGSHPWVRATGHMERALRVLLEWGFAEQGLETVIWWANKGNWSSRKVAWRLGFTFEGTVRSWLPQRGERRDAWVGTLLREDPREPGTPWLACPVLEGDGIRLRPFTPADVPRIVEACIDLHTQFWLAGLPRAYGEADAWAYLDEVSERLATSDGVSWAVVDPQQDLVLGAVSLFGVRVGRECELGYWAHPEGRGRGLVTRGARLAIRHAVEDLGVQRVTASSSVTNKASRRVIEKCGLRQSGIDRLAARTGDGAAVDLVRYDLLAGELTSPR